MNNQRQNKFWEKGVVSVYMALIVVIIMVASTLILTDVISRQFQSATDVEFTERAFYAASTGFEHASYLIATGSNTDITEVGTLDYAEGSAEYHINASFIVINGRITNPSICSEGQFRSATRRLIVNC